MHSYTPGESIPLANYSLCERTLDCVDEERNLGIIISNDLKISKQCLKVAKTANRVLGHSMVLYKGNHASTVPLYIELQKSFCII